MSESKSIYAVGFNKNLVPGVVPIQDDTLSVYVVGGYNTDTERVDIDGVVTDLAVAQEMFRRAKVTYGGANAFMASRGVNAADSRPSST